MKQIHWSKIHVPGPDGPAALKCMACRAKSVGPSRYRPPKKHGDSAAGLVCCCGPQADAARAKIVNLAMLDSEDDRFEVFLDKNG